MSRKVLLLKVQLAWLYAAFRHDCLCFFAHAVDAIGLHHTVPSDSTLVGLWSASCRSRESAAEAERRGGRECAAVAWGRVVVSRWGRAVSSAAVGVACERLGLAACSPAKFWSSGPAQR